MEYVLFSLVAAVAFFNGANDVSKGVATLHGSGLASYRSALGWGTVWTVLGGVSAFFIASGLLKVFTKGIVSSEAGLTTGFSAAVAAGVAAWLLLSTRAGMPVSTTHSIVGAITGAALVAFPTSMVLWDSLGTKILIPLLLSPVAALLITTALYGKGKELLGRIERYCLCLEMRESVCSGPATEGNWLAMESVSKNPVIEANRVERCVENFASPLRKNFNDMAHWASSALISFARGLNDTPKLVALLAVSASVSGGAEVKNFFLLAVAFMGLGSYMKGVKVTETLSEKITGMDRKDSVIANFSTAALVVVASKLGMPVSTTHVSGSSIIGIGLRRDARALNRKVVSEILLAWVVTLPVSGVISAVAYLALNRMS